MFICLLWPHVAPCREALGCYNKDICSASAQNNPSNYSAVSSAVLILNCGKPYFWPHTRTVQIGERSPASNHYKVTDQEVEGEFKIAIVFWLGLCVWDKCCMCVCVHMQWCWHGSDWPEMLNKHLCYEKGLPPPLSHHMWNHTTSWQLPK